MYIDKKKAKGSVYYYIIWDEKDAFGNKFVKRIPLGTLEQIKKEYDNKPLEFLRMCLKLIDTARKELKQEEEEAHDEIPDLVGGEIVNLGVLYFLWFLKYFTVDDFLELMQKHSKAVYKLANLLNFCVGFRLFDPGSIRYECEMNRQWPLQEDIKNYDVYRYLDRFYDLSFDIQHLLWIRTSEFMKDKRGQPLVLLFDGTNLFTFMRAPEQDLYDDKGRLIYKAFRTKGMSKENRNQPLVGLGLFVREGGMPVAWSEQAGNRPEIAYLPEELKKIMETFRPKQFILVADRGNWSGNVISTVLGLDKETGSDNFYIIGKGVRKAPKKTQDWAADRDGEFTITYKNDKDKEKSAVIKVRIINQPIKCTKKDGKTVTLEVPQMEIVRFSAVYARKEKHKRDQLEMSRSSLSNVKYRFGRNSNFRFGSI